jgi:transcriptional regulator with XRE-family HTH domain
MAETFGERLQRLRTARGLSRYAVSKATGLSQPLLGQLEGYQSGYQIRAVTLQRLAKFYGLTMEELLGPPDEEESQAA